MPAPKKQIMFSLMCDSDIQRKNPSSNIKIYNETLLLLEMNPFSYFFYPYYVIEK